MVSGAPVGAGHGRSDVGAVGEYVPVQVARTGGDQNLVGDSLDVVDLGGVAASESAVK